MDKLVFLPTEKHSLWSSISLWFFCGLGILFALISIVNAIREWPGPSSTKSLVIGVPILLFMVWFRWQFTGQSTITIDARGLTQRQPVISPHIDWINVASVQVRESTRMVNGAGAQVRVHRRIAEIATKDKRRVTIVLSTLSDNDQQTIQRYLEEAVQTGRAPVGL